MSQCLGHCVIKGRGSCKPLTSHTETEETVNVAVKAGLSERCLKTPTRMLHQDLLVSWKASWGVLAPPLASPASTANEPAWISSIAVPSESEEPCPSRLPLALLHSVTH